MAREILFDLGKMITDRLPYKFGLKRLTETDPVNSLIEAFRGEGSILPWDAGARP